MSFKIRTQEVGGGRCYVVGEVGQGHEGNLNLAHAYIDAVAAAGADGVKFQCHIAAAESTKEERWRVKFSRYEETRYEYWERMEFKYLEWEGLGEHAHEVGLGFIVSPFSIEALESLATMWDRKKSGSRTVDAWKVASGEVTNLALLKAMKAMGRPVILSSGMSTEKELKEAYRVFGTDYPMVSLQCTSMYPCPPEKVGLNQVLNEVGSRFNGLSDHTGSIYTGLAAAALGCDLLEVHVAMSRQMPGPDTSSSITIEELEELVEGVRWIERINSNPVDKDEMAKELGPMRKLFMKSRQPDGSYRKSGEGATV